MNRTLTIVLLFAILLIGAQICAAQGNRDKERFRNRERDYDRDESDYYNGRSDRVLFEKVTALTFHRGDYTTGRRSSPIPALQCIGGTASDKKFQPEVVQCTRVGFDGSDAQWRCEADLSTDVKFGEVDVSCEGYAYPDDVYILKGSCGLKYKLELTDAGKQRKKYDESHPYKGPTKKVETIEYATPKEDDGVLPLFGSWGGSSPSSWFSGFSLWSLIKWGFYISLFTSVFFGYSILKWILSLVFLPVTLPLRILSFLFGGSSAQPNPYGGGYYHGGNHYQSGGLMSDMLGSYFTPKAYQAPASGGGFWSGIFYGGLAGSLLGKWLGGGGRQTRQQPQPVPVRIVKEKEDPRDKRPEPASSRVAAGFGGTSRR